eukprot:TRINITY_DN19643_c0_g1_i1.p1 TRINITY_DN19643_c0_g1~~TRINITY_DN19643_c0_g1_i1.p1  ORF type:complete len:255 (+),score=56.70 TRINITY_DN19643_c0_g1_i1:132-896(+)
MIRRPPRSTLSSSSAASDVYKRQGINAEYGGNQPNPMVLARMARCHLYVGRQMCTAQQGKSWPDKELRLYKGAWINPLRLLLRAKLMQLGAASAFAAPLGMSAMGQTPTMSILGLSAAILSGCGIASGAMYFYGRRYVGLLSLLPGGEQLRISTLSFWGVKEDTVVDVSRVVAPFAGLPYRAFAGAAQSTFFPMMVEGEREFIISLRWWPIEDKFAQNSDQNKMLIRLLRGRTLRDKKPDGSATSRLQLHDCNR